MRTYHTTEKNTVSFRSVAVGELFSNSAQLLFMKVGSDGAVNAVSLNTGRLHIFGDDASVYPVSYEPLKWSSV